MMGLPAFILAIALFMPSVFASNQETILHRFQGNNDGSGPKTGLIADSAGNIYGTTFDGGSPSGAGTIFQLRPPVVTGQAWTETILHRFDYGDISGGLGPWGGLVADKTGNLYGTAWLGGACGSCGLAFQLSPSSIDGSAWTFNVIHNFSESGFDGINPRAKLTIDGAGNLFGTTSSGGTGACMGGCGVVFEISPSGGNWVETVLYNFPAHGSQDNKTGGTLGGVALDKTENLYGTTWTDHGLGTVFKLSPPLRGHRWKYETIYSFLSLNDGAFPEAGVTLDASGDLYGTTNQGGSPGCYGFGCGTIFRLTPSQGQWIHTVLYNFTGTGDGSLPGDVTVAGAGSIYGATGSGGVGSGCSGLGCGVAFRLTPPRTRVGAWTESVLHTFRGGRDGFGPVGGVVFGKDGLLYGATILGGKPSCSNGSGCGTVFAVSP